MKIFSFSNFEFYKTTPAGWIFYKTTPAGWIFYKTTPAGWIFYKTTPAGWIFPSFAIFSFSICKNGSVNYNKGKGCNKNICFFLTFTKVIGNFYVKPP